MKKVSLHPFLRHLFAFCGALVVTIVFLIGASLFPVNNLRVTNWIGYGIIFVIFPITMTLVLIFLKKNPIRWYMIAMCVLVVFLSTSWYYYRMIEVYDDVSVYENENSPFIKAANMVLPEPALFPENAAFSYRKSATLKIIELTIPTSNSKHEEVMEQLEEAFEHNTYAYSEQYDFRLDSEPLCTEENVFTCYVFSVDGCDYAVAYHFDIDTSTVQYIFFTSPQLAWMSANGALEIEGYLPQH